MSVNLFLFYKFSSVHFSHSAACDSLWPHGLQHAWPPGPSPNPRVYSNSYPLSWWCHPTISSSVVPCGHYWIFQIFWHIECSTFTASSFRTWNSSTGIPLPLLALFIVTLPNAHLTSHSRWFQVIIWVVKTFLYSYSVYSCHLFLTSSASVRSIPFLSFIEPIFAWNVPLVSLIFLKRSLVFPIL